MGFDKLDYANKDIWDKLAEKIDTYILYYPELETEKQIPKYNIEKGYYEIGDGEKFNQREIFIKNVKMIM